MTKIDNDILKEKSTEVEKTKDSVYAGVSKIVKVEETLSEKKKLKPRVDLKKLRDL